jgi:hypothetical protein
MNTLVIWLLRAALVVILVVSVLLQIGVPIYASNVGRWEPKVDHLVIPYSVALILFIVCGQVAIIATWRLLSLVTGGVIFTAGALRWVNVIIVSASVAVGLTACVLIHLWSFIPTGPGPTVFYVAGAFFAGLTFVLLMIVMRGLLVAAVADRTELDAVI